MITRPSDTAINAANYTAGVGYYTDMTRITDLLGIAPLTANTIPTLANVGELIRYAEDYIDEYTKETWRPMIIKDEFHDFDFDWHRMYRYSNRASRYTDYVGMVRLNYENLRKVIRLSAWKGDTWNELASSTSTVTISDYTNVTSLVLQLPNSGTSYTLTASSSVGPTHSNANVFNIQFGNVSTAQELVYLINEQLPVNTREFTGQDGKKNGSGVSSFFYASLEDDNTVLISSLLPADDGKNCTITTSGSGISAGTFSDNETVGRSNDWWTMDSDGTIFFKTTYPYQQKHSIRVTYETGGNRVPAIITEAATKIVSCELMSSDDNTILLGENSESGLDIKTKFDTYRADIEKILTLKKRLIYVLDSD